MAGASVIRLSVVNDASRALRVVNKDAQKLSKTVKNSNGQLKDQSKGLKTAALGWLGVKGGATAATPAIVGAGMAMATALAPIAALTSGIALLTAGFKVIADQDKANAALRTLGVDAEELVPKLKTVSAELGHQFSQTELTAAAYDVASAGFTNAADAALVLKASAQAAAGGMADLNTTGDAVTTILNAWKLEATEATKVADMMQQTVADGKIKIQQYADNIGKVATTASQLKIPLSEVNAAISQATVSGVNAERAFTGINAALAQIASGQAGKHLNMEINAATLESEGLLETLRKIASVPVGDQIKALGREGHAAMGPVLADLEKYEELLKNQINSTGAAAEAQKQQADTIGGAWKELTVVLSNLFSSQNELGIAVKNLIQAVTVGIKAIAWVLKPVFKMVNDIMWSVNKIIEGVKWLRNQAGNLVDKFLGKPVDTEVIKDNVNTIKEDLTEIADPITPAVVDGVNQVDQGFNNIANTINGAMKTGIKELIKGTKTLNEALASVAAKIGDAFLDMGITALMGQLKIPGLGKKASGGPVSRNTPYVVGERGPEIFTPNSAGKITANNKMGGGASSVVVNVDASSSNAEGDSNSSRELGMLIGAAVQSELIRQQRPGGLLTA